MNLDKYEFSEEIIVKVLDGDFHTKIERVPYSTSPREVVTIYDIEKYYKTMGDEGYEEEVP